MERWRSFYQFFQFINNFIHLKINEFSFPSLTRFNTYEDVSTTLLYMFSINDGPIWSIKFHPFVIASDERIGILAVTTANQNVLVFSLPYLNGDESNRNLVISLEPSIICKLSEATILNHDKYLLQVSSVNWFSQKESSFSMLAAGYINGFLAMWRIHNDDDEKKSPTQLLPYLIFQPHYETVTSIDFKSFGEPEFLMLTTSMDRDMKVFAIENDQYREIACHYAASRNTCAEWCLNWPGYLYGNDNCFTFAGLSYRQPVDFATRNLQLHQSSSAVSDLSMNHWLNFAIFACDSGDIMGTNPNQLVNACPKDRWSYFGNTIFSFTDAVKFDEENYGIVFSDIRSRVATRPKTFRILPNELSLILQINTLRFNRNEMSHHFYAIGYETGFVRIKHLKNFK